MASLAREDDGDDEIVVLRCVESLEQDENNRNEVEDIVTISTIDATSWNFPSILQHNVIKLIEQSSYFRGLLRGNFNDPDPEIVVQWNQPTFLSLLASLFGVQVDVSSENFVSLFEGALYFGMETIISECMMWLTNVISVNGVTILELNDLVSIWKFLVNTYLPEPCTAYLATCTAYLAKNFIWAMSCSSFCDVPYELLLSSTEHPHLTVDSEKQLCDALLVWISANKRRYPEDACINLLKQIRVSLLPKWFAAGRDTYQSLSMCHRTVLKQPFTGGWLNLRIRLTEFTQQVDLSGCPQINLAILFLSMFPCSLILKTKGKQRIKKLLKDPESVGRHDFRWREWPKLAYISVHEIDISNCPKLNFEVSVEIFSKFFPSLRKLKAANQITFRTLKLLKMAKICPLLSDIDLTVDVSPVIPARVSVLSSFIPVSSPGTSYIPWCKLAGPLSINITKLTLEGRTDIDDIDLQGISDICVSLTYISLRGCSSVSDAGIATFISKCLKLNSIVACDTGFGQQSVLVLCSDHLAANESA